MSKKQAKRLRLSGALCGEGAKERDATKKLEPLNTGAERMVYSTNPYFQYQYDEEPQAETLPPAKQRLRVQIDRHHRGGKTVTLVTGFVGSDNDLQDLGRRLKNACGVGGSAKDGEMMVQGDQLEKVKGLLASWGYGTR